MDWTVTRQAQPGTDWHTPPTCSNTCSSVQLLRPSRPTFVHCIIYMHIRSSSILSVTFSLCPHHRPLNSSTFILYAERGDSAWNIADEKCMASSLRLVTETHGCEQLAQGRYSTARRPGLELATSGSPVRCRTDHAACDICSNRPHLSRLANIDEIIDQVVDSEIGPRTAQTA